MPNLRLVVPLTLLALLTAAPASAATITNYFPSCPSPPSEPGQVLTVDPTHRMSSTYASVLAAIRAAKPGDTIALTTGDYGDLNLEKVSFPNFVTITAASGQTPHFTRIIVGRSSHLRLNGLTVSGMSKPILGKWIHDNLIQVSVSDSIILDHNDVASSSGTMVWLPELPDSPVGDAPSHGINVQQSSCVSIVENHIHNIFNGISFGGKSDDANYFLVSGNRIDNFAGDGIDHFASHVRIIGNQIVDGHDICKSLCVHMDGIQGWNFNRLPITNTDVEISGNTVIAQQTPNLAFPIEILQGITIFDGTWRGVKIFNNVIVDDAWHGITVNGGDDVSIVNNTVIGANPKMSSWIMYHTPKDEPPGSPNTSMIRNNFVTSAVKPEAYPKGTIVDHNMSPKKGDYSGIFVKFDPEHFAYDLHPGQGSPLIGGGTSDGAPVADIEGSSRQGSADVGAYRHK